MNVLFHLLDAEVAGGQTVALRIAAEAARRGHGVGLAVPGPGPMVDRFARIGARTRFVPPADLGRPRAALRLAAALRGYDVLYSHTAVPGQVLGEAAARLAGRPHVVHQHSEPYFTPRPLAGSVQRRLFRRLGAARFVAVAEHVAGSLVAVGVPRSRVVVVPNGGPEPASLPTPRGGRGAVRVGMVARLDPGKGIDEFVEAVTPLVADGVEARIAGRPGPFRDYERALEARLRGGPVALRWSEEGEAFLAGLDVVAIPSHREGSPLVLFEAMALGRAVVATAIPGIREVVEDGRNGLLVPPADPPALRRALLRLARDPGLRERLGAAARLDVARRFPIRRTVDRCLALLEEAVREAAGPGGPR